MTQLLTDISSGIGTVSVEISVVVPIFNEIDTIAQLHRRLSATLKSLGTRFELVLIDDGSTDGSGPALEQLARSDTTVTAVHLSRNFGHQSAVTAGLRFASGAAVVIMDADLQDPPELIPEMVKAWRSGSEIVYAQRAERRQDPRLKRLLAWGYYRVLTRLSDVPIPTDAGDYCLLDRRIVDILNDLPERHRYVRGLRAWVGFRQRAVRFHRDPRAAGASKYTFRRSLTLATTGLVSLSTAPLRAATWLGLVVSASSFLLAVAFTIQKLTVGFQVRGWASLVVIVLFLGGVQLLTIGIIGEYLGRIYDEVKQRPSYVVRAVNRAQMTELVS